MRDVTGARLRAVESPRHDEVVPAAAASRVRVVAAAGVRMVAARVRVVGPAARHDVKARRAMRGRVAYRAGFTDCAAVRPPVVREIRMANVSTVRVHTSIPTRKTATGKTASGKSSPTGIACWPALTGGAVLSRVPDRGALTGVAAVRAPVVRIVRMAQEPAIWSFAPKRRHSR